MNEGNEESNNPAVSNKSKSETADIMLNQEEQISAPIGQDDYASATKSVEQKDGSISNKTGDLEDNFDVKIEETTKPKKKSKRRSKPLIHTYKSKEDITCEYILRTYARTLKITSSDKIDAATKQKIEDAITLANSDIGEVLTEKLLKIIADICDRKDDYIKREYKKKGNYFSKPNCAITLKALITITLAYGDNALTTELLKIYQCDIETPKASALCNRRKLIESKLFEDLFRLFCDELFKICGVFDKKYLGFWVLALDGSKMNIPYNPEDEETFIQQDGKKGYNQLHLSCVLDVLNGIYVDALLKPIKQMDEREACRTLLETVTSRYSMDLAQTILIMDRGYDGFYQLHELLASGIKFLFRTKDIHSEGSMLSFLRNIVGEHEEIDRTFHLILTKNPKYKNKAGYKYIEKKIYFPYLDEHEFCEIEFRVVRIDLNQNADELKDRYECLVTNLTVQEIPTCKMKELYYLRWGEEISFYRLKVSIGARSLHHRNRGSVEQEIWALLTQYNYISAIYHQVLKTWTALEKALPKEYKLNLNWQHDHLTNFAAVVTISRDILIEELREHCFSPRFQHPIKLPFQLALRHRTPQRRRDPKRGTKMSQGAAAFNNRSAV